MGTHSSKEPSQSSIMMKIAVLFLLLAAASTAEPSPKRRVKCNLQTGISNACYIAVRNAFYKKCLRPPTEVTDMKECIRSNIQGVAGVDDNCVACMCTFLMPKKKCLLSGEANCQVENVC